MEYKFSVTKNYVKDWGVTEGIREILQNAIDSSGAMTIDVGDNYISISNKGIKLPIKTLLLGCGNKSNDKNSVGGFAEGSLLAIMTLVREGYDLDITNSDEKWLPSFKYDEGIQEEILCIDTKPCNNTDSLTYIISGLSKYNIEDLQEEFLDLRPKNKGKYKSIKTYYGEIILDKEYAGKMFVEGLPIAKDDNFEYGYNFKAQHVNLDRDRKSINIYELKTLTANAIASLSEDNFAIIDKIIDSGNSDGDYIKDKDVNIENEEQYAKHLMDRFNITDKTIVCTDNKVFDVLTKQVQDNPELEVKTLPKKIYVDIVNNHHTLSNEKVSSVEKQLNSEDKKEKARTSYEYSDYKTFREWLIQYRDILSEDAIDSFKSILINIEPAGFGLIEEELEEI